MFRADTKYDHPNLEITVLYLQLANSMYVAERNNRVKNYFGNMYMNGI